ncbi:cyanophycinase [Pararcticibacter amylolyticus]|uniref:Cyanophycinase n=1 Tax=Pararcticibacter amylolyticus TaxID=2173175 RepID=A0A2U2PHR6_9SPHI|nr:cyanophycinase [Pararcticibacter amylolyticus]PWG80953.1 cyanophycinase [Pararcticibacter amylolyticus]
MKTRWISPCIAKLLSPFLAVIFSFSVYSQPAKGSLFIIGGGSRSPELMKQLVSTADLSVKDYVVVLPMASEEPEESFQAVAQQFRAAGVNKITCFNFTKETTVRKPWCDSTAQAKIIFITGGSQDRFMDIVRGTPVYDAIHDAYRKGATIAGTSAGAAVMSHKMITGNQLKGDTSYKETFDKLWDKNIEFKQGMGLLHSVIIDQHFLKRSRYNRLLSALAANPSYTCIGIDEGTAIIVKGKHIKVAGDSQVIRVSQPKGLQVNAKGLIRLKDLKFSVFAAGDEFDLPQTP